MEKSHTVLVLSKLLAMATLHFIATGSFQKTVGVVGGISQTTFSRCLDHIITAISDCINCCIVRQDLMELKRGLYAIANFPNVLGTINCTHVAIILPHDREEIFRNRKLFHSLNVQVVGMRILDVVDGSHAEFLYENFEDGLYGNSWLEDTLYRESQNKILIQMHQYQHQETATKTFSALTQEAAGPSQQATGTSSAPALLQRTFMMNAHTQVSERRSSSNSLRRHCRSFNLWVHPAHSMCPSTFLAS
ncbi:putative nuclease HARBI1 [Rhinatrema bivittatum]|uniref:putative nuclease HARBI1 n=1 Tax=Rhinatrema bivittatum TaxID=194408 RepID=UPI001128A1C4|nr:putative nuclease HARBI1 [Rhinatrema bivittatum]